MTATGIQGRSTRDVAQALLAMVVISVLFLGWGLLGSHEMGAIARLPSPTRQEIHARSHANLEAVCKGADARRFEAFCRTQAEVVIALPECGESCAALARSVLLYPTR